MAVFRRGPWMPRPGFVTAGAHRLSLGWYATVNALASGPCRCGASGDLARMLKRSGITTGILSNMQPDLLARLRGGAPWLDAFDVQVFSCEIGFVKPERQIYEYLL